MSVELIKYAFSSGEISPTLYGRSDLTKFDMGMALAYNWFVDYRGGLSTRPGTEFVDYVPLEDQPTKMFTFRFSPALADNYVLLFGHNYMIPIQNGGYITRRQRVWTMGTPEPNGKWLGNTADYAALDWVKVVASADFPQFVGATLEVNALDGTGVRLTNVADKQQIDTTTFAGGAITVEQIVRIVTPYAGTDLDELSLFQIRNTCRMTHPRFPIKNLVRGINEAWSINDEVIGNNIPIASGLGATPSATGPISFLFAVTSINSDGLESPMSKPFRVTNCVNYTTEAGSCRFTWSQVSGAIEYRVYRSVIVGTGGPITFGAQLGYLGTTKTTDFIDSNIIPDFTKSPPSPRNPFARGSIYEIVVTSPGTGYTDIPDIVASGAGVDFLAYGNPSIDGALGSVTIIREGSGYPENTVITTSGGSGSGATFSTKVTELTGTYPSISAIFQQRQVYAASYNNPLTLWASQTSKFNVFDESAVLVSSDAYEFEVDSTEISPIRHMFSMRGGLLLLSQTGVWMLTGGSSQQAVTPTNALADPQSYTGVSDVVPLKIGPDLLYVEGTGYSVRLLSYNDFSKIYSGEDKSVLSNHLFGPGFKITKWAYAENPFKMVWGVREDGAIVCFTMVKEQEVYGWTWGQTKGLFDDIVSVQENDFDYCYTTVIRLVNGMWRKYVERIAPRDFLNVEDSWCVDSGLKLFTGQMVTPDNTLTISPEYEDIFTDTSGNTQTIKKVKLTAALFSFNTASLDYVVRAAGGIFRVTRFINSKEVEANVITSATKLLPEDPDKRVMPVAAGDWYYTKPVTTIYGLSHLEGETVSILADGNVAAPQKVVNGSITLQHPATKVIVGLPYSCVAKTLPDTTQQAVIEAKRKRTVGLGIRFNETRGLMYGISLKESDLYAVRERTTEPYGVPTKMINGVKYVIPSTEWGEDNQTYFVQNNPLPSTILGLVTDMEIGDDSE